MINHTQIQGPIVRTSNNIVSDMDGEKVMLDIANGKYYNLGAVGGRIWELLQVPLTFDELIAQLLSEYDVEQEECESHVAAFLQQLSAEGLVVINA